MSRGVDVAAPLIVGATRDDKGNVVLDGATYNKVYQNIKHRVRGAGDPKPPASPEPGPSGNPGRDWESKYRQTRAKYELLVREHQEAKKNLEAASKSLAERRSQDNRQQYLSLAKEYGLKDDHRFPSVAKLLEYDPGDGEFDEKQARKALKAAQKEWSEFFSETQENESPTTKPSGGPTKTAYSLPETAPGRNGPAGRPSRVSDGMHVRREDFENPAWFLSHRAEVLQAKADNRLIIVEAGQGG